MKEEGREGKQQSRTWFDVINMQAEKKDVFIMKLPLYLLISVDSIDDGSSYLSPRRLNVITLDNIIYQVKRGQAGVSFDDTVLLQYACGPHCHRGEIFFWAVMKKTWTTSFSLTTSDCN